MVQQKDFQGVLDAVRAHYRPAHGTTFALFATDTYTTVVHPSQVGNDNHYGATVGGYDTGQPVRIYIHQDWITRWIMDGQVGNLINTIEHEATHAAQAGGGRPDYVEDIHAKEFDAFCHEIELAHQKLGTGAPLPTETEIALSFKEAGSHFSKLSATASARERARWEAVQQAYTVLKTALDRNDEHTGASNGVLERLARLNKAAFDLKVRLTDLENRQVPARDDVFRQLDSEVDQAYLATLREASKVNTSARVRPVGSFRLTSEQIVGYIEQLQEDVTRYRMNGPPKRKKAPKAPAASAGGSSPFSTLLPPPPSSSSPAKVPSLLPPPPSSAGASASASAIEEDEWGTFTSQTPSAPNASASTSSSASASATSSASAPTSTSTTAQAEADWANFDDFEPAPSAPAPASSSSASASAATPKPPNSAPH